MERKKGNQRVDRTYYSFNIVKSKLEDQEWERGEMINAQTRKQEENTTVEKGE